MANNTSFVTVGKPKVGGAVWRAPIGTALPTDATSTLAAAFQCLGYVSEDGLTNGTDVTIEEIKAWGGDTVLNTMTAFSDTFNFTSLEALNEEVLRAYYGDGAVSGDLATGLTVAVHGGNAQAYSWVFDMIMRGDVLKRIVLPNAELTEKGDVVYVDGEPVGYEMTLSALPDISGNTHYEYMYGGSVGATYYVTFNANGHGTAPGMQMVLSGEAAAEPADPVAAGYTFGGWYTEAACTNAYDFTDAVTGSITLYAKWSVA